MSNPKVNSYLMFPPSRPNSSYPSFYTTIRVNMPGDVEIRVQICVKLESPETWLLTIKCIPNERTLGGGLLPGQLDFTESLSTSLTRMDSKYAAGVIHHPSNAASTPLAEQ